MKKKFIPYSDYTEPTPAEMKNRADEYYSEMSKRRTVRHFSDRPVPLEIIKTCLKTASTAPSGAHMQPWSFVVVSDDELKLKIHVASEQVEENFYTNPANRSWIKDLEPMGVNQSKPFLAAAPYLIAVFYQSYGFHPDGTRRKHYYVKESVGIATGLLISAIHHVGLTSLTYTPSKNSYLNDLLNRPQNEKPYLVLVVGYPEDNVMVPDIKRKSLEDIATFV